MVVQPRFQVTGAVLRWFARRRRHGQVTITIRVPPIADCFPFKHILLESFWCPLSSQRITILVCTIADFLLNFFLGFAVSSSSGFFRQAIRSIPSQHKPAMVRSDLQHNESLPTWHKITPNTHEWEIYPTLTKPTSCVCGLSKGYQYN